jgi:CheY-like chemotaxis protein
LPLELDLPGIADDERRLAATQLSSMPMLILAKEEITRKAIEVVLRRIGAPGDYIGSSQLAVQLMTFKNASHESRYQLIIVDYAVDRGVELLLAALQDQFSVHQKPKVVVFLDHDDAKLGKRLRDLGAEVILPKPVLPSLVFNSLLDLFTDTVMKSLSVQSIEHVAEMDGVSLSILVVEDNAVNRTIAKEILERAGFSVILAENGAIGYEKFIENKDVISLILMDLHMDVMDGFEATEKIRLVDATTPIFALTADVVGDIRVRCRNAGFTRIITKPYNPAKLIHHIVETVGNSMKHATKVSEEFHFLDIEKGVRRVDGDTALYKKIVRIFSQEMEDDVMQLLDHVKSEQWQQMGLLAHKIKGSAEAIGAERLAHCARQLQEIIKLENGDIPDALQSLSFEVSQVRNEIQSFLT